MILVDANLLIYAHVSHFPQHKDAKDWLDGRLNAPEPVALPWPSLLSFLRLVTNPRVFERPETITKAWKQVEEWLRRPSAWIPQPTERHPEILASLLIGQNLTGNLVPDAHLAALSLEHGLILCSTDSDFGRFSELKWENPLS